MAPKINKKVKKTSPQSFLKGAMVMSISMMIVKLCGMFYKVLLTRVYNMFGSEYGTIGTGLFSNAYEIYIPLFTLATAGFPIAVSRLISESNAQKRYKDIRQIHKVSIPFFICMGIICAGLMFGGAFFYVEIIKSPYAIYSMLILAPTIFFGCLVSIYRGYFEGLRNMTPTAVSEIIEAASKLLIGLSLAYIIMRLGLSSYESTGTIFGLIFNTKKEAVYTLIGFSVAGAVGGITIGSILSFLYLFLKYKFSGGGITDEAYLNSVDARSKKETFVVLMKTAIPIGLGALVMSISSTIDSAIIQNVIYHMAVTNRTELLKQYPMYESAIPIHPTKDDPITIQTSLWGCYGAALTIMQLVTALTQVFGTTAMPNVTNAYTVGNKENLKNSIENVLKLTTMVTFPLGLGLFVLADPVMDCVYSGHIALIGGKCLRVMGISVLFIACSTPICSMLQGVGKVNTPVKLYVIGMIIKIAVNFGCVSIVSINIQGAAIGSMIGYLFVCVAGLYTLIKHTHIIPDFKCVVIKPLISAIVCAFVAFGTYSFIFSGLNKYISLILSIIIGAVFYLIALFALRTFNRKDFESIPKSKKVVTFLAKLHLIR